MQEYKPKRFEFRDLSKDMGWCRSISFSLAREQYRLTKDYYVDLKLWRYSITIVFLRLYNK